MTPLAIPYPRPYFAISRSRDGFLYALAPRTLIKIDVDTGKITNTYGFKGGGPAFPEVTPDRELNFFTFTILDGGRLWLGPAFIWGYDLMTARLPTPSESGKAEKGASP